MFRLNLILLFFLVQVVSASAQIDKSISFRRLDARDIGTENCSYQCWDDKGGCWFKADKGIIENNGFASYRYRYDPSNDNSILNDTVHRIFSTSPNEIFISYETLPYVTILNTTTRSFQHHEVEELKGENGGITLVTHIESDHYGNVYVMTWGNGISRFDRETGEFSSYSLALESDTIHMNSRPKDMVRLRGDKYLVCFFRQGRKERGYPIVTDVITGENYELPIDDYRTNETGEIANHKYQSAMVNVSCAYVDKEANIWMGCYSGLYLLDRTKKLIRRITDTGDDYRRNVVNIKTIEEMNGDLWCGSPNMGLLRVNMNNESFKYVQSDPFNPITLYDDRTLTQSKDHMGNLWICSEDGMISIYVPIVDRFKLHSWKDMGTKFSERAQQVIPVNQMLVEEDKGTVLISSEAGLQRFSPAMGKTVDRISVIGRENLERNMVANFKVVGDSILMVLDGQIGFYHESADELHLLPRNRGSFRFLFRHSHPYSEIIFFRDWKEQKHQEFLLLNKTTGLFEPLYALPEGVQVKETFTCELGSGKWLISEREGRFVIFDRANLTHELYSPSQTESYFPDSTVRIAMVEDERIFIGTEKGLYEFDEYSKEATLINEKIGLKKSDIISALVRDEMDRLWIALDKDLVCWDEKAGTMRRYTNEHGLNIGSFLPAIGQMDDKGYLYFATINGMLVFNPMSLEVPDLPLELGVLNIIMAEDTLYERDYTEDIELNFHWNDDEIVFEFFTNQVFQLTPHHFEYRLKEQGEKWMNNGSSNKIRFHDLPHGDYTLEVRATNGFEITSEPYTIEFTVQRPFWLAWWFYSIIIIIVGASIWYYVKRRERSLRQRSELLENTVAERTAEVLEQKEEADRQREIVEEKQQEITDSITYAKRIQDAILPTDEFIKANLPKAFVLYRPKDIVAGDFYWLEQQTKDEVIFAAADCTGHGVPGAMVSVVCNNAMNRAVREFKISDPGKLLDSVRELVVEQFDRSSSKNDSVGDETLKDGMDISLCNWNQKTNVLKWAGAHNPLWLMRNNELLETKGNKQPVGKFHLSEAFTTHTVQLEKGDRFYLITDGYADQFGGEKGKKFKSSSLKKLLVSIHQEPIQRQKQLLEENFDSWKGEYEQLDDVCIIGVEV